jgi:GNAT superfamily N-acetyltransferase
MRLLFLFVLLSFITASGESTSFKVDSSTHYLAKIKEYSLNKDDQKIGQLTSIKLPLCNWYLLLDFYVNKDYRNQGYGKLIFKKVLDDIKKRGGTKLFLQPGPFEYENGNVVTIQGGRRQERINALVKFYESFGFRITRSKFLTKFLAAAYKIVGIPEDSNYFMVSIV